MQIVIDIPDNEYKQICELRLHNRTFYDDAIRNGTPLPSHGRLIDADELKKIIQENDVLNMTGFNVRLCDINNTPTILEATKGESE